LICFHHVQIPSRKPCPSSTQQHQNHTIPPQKHLTDKPILIHRFTPRLPRPLRPHLLDVLQHHVAVAVEGFDPGEQLAVVAAGNQDLGVGAGGGLEDREGAGGEFVRFEEGDFVFSVSSPLD
jgi:hypothetical protein